MVQKERLACLPDVESLRRLSQSLAMLDAILSPEWEYRYYSFNSKWGSDEMMASMRNGSGDDYFLLFNQHGAILKGFAHESPMSPFASDPPKVWSGVLESVPSEFRDFLSEPAFSLEATTFCIWRKYSDSHWQTGEVVYPNGLNMGYDGDPDGSEDLLSILDGKPASYQEFAKYYFEEEVSLFAIQHIYEHNPLTKEVVVQLNGELSLEELQDEIDEIGYPQREKGLA